MSIGSSPEIGTEFTTWGAMSDAARLRWFEYMRTLWGADLLGGYATLCYPDKELRDRYGAV